MQIGPPRKGIKRVTLGVRGSRLGSGGQGYTWPTTDLDGSWMHHSLSQGRVVFVVFPIAVYSCSAGGACRHLPI